MYCYIFNCKGDNLRDAECQTCYFFELRFKCHTVHRVSDWWLLANRDSVKNKR